MQIENFSIDLYDDVITLWKAVNLSLGSSDTREEIERVLKRNPTLFLVGKIDEKIISAVFGGFDGRRGFVHHLAVHPKFQKQGYGKLMMNELMKRFKELDVHKVHLFIEIENEGVVDFYSKQGWHLRDDLKMMSYLLKNPKNIRE